MSQVIVSTAGTIATKVISRVFQDIAERKIATRFDDMKVGLEVSDESKAFPFRGVSF